MSKKETCLRHAYDASAYDTDRTNSHGGILRHCREGMINGKYSEAGSKRSEILYAGPS